MALAACRECGQQVSTEAATCPRCGVPNPTGSAVPGTRDVAAAHGVRDASATNTSNATLAEPRHMTAQENPVYQAHVHWIVYMKAALVALAAVITIGATTYAGLAPYAGIGLFVVAAILAGMAYMQSSSTEFVITTRRLIAKRGIASRRTIETLLEKVEAVTVEQGLWGRMLDYGKVTVIGTGGTNETFTLVAHPMKLRQVIHEQIDNTR